MSFGNERVNRSHFEELPMPVLPTHRSRLLLQLAPSGLESGTLPAGLEAVAPHTAGRPAWAAATSRDAAHPWDEAHRALAEPSALGLESVPPAYAEPDFVQGFPYRQAEGGFESDTQAGPCEYTGPIEFWPWPNLGFAWHLRDEYSGLKAARDHVGDHADRVRVVILDTGFDPEHVTLPAHLSTELQRNFADGDASDATDPGRHQPLDNPGHGTATLALLAGKRVRVGPPRFRFDFDDYLGGAPHAEVVPVRIANSVLHFWSGVMAAGIAYAARIRAAVVSVSMGGLPSRAWADAVNRAYEAGVAIFAAAGNRIGPSPPATIVYPARFRRVVAVCGVTSDGSPYYREGWHRNMQGCFGPKGKMETALAAYTPNTPWASMGCRDMITHDGNGTSSATPQAAAAAALWLQANAPPGAEPWRRVEAVRHALFSSADKSQPDGERYFGQGLLRARQALDVPFRADLPQTPADEVSFAWLRLLGGFETGRGLMYEVEALQVYEQTPRLQEITGWADPASDRIDDRERKRLVEGLAASPLASQALRAHLTELHRKL
jgi:hypothetical protein